MKILVADDHALLRKGLRDCLDLLEEGCEVAEAATFAEAMDRLTRDPAFDLAVIDLYMPGMEGVRGIEAIRARFPRLRILVVSGSVDRADALAALRHGADGYVPKTMDLKAFHHAVRLVLAGERFVPSLLLDDTGGLDGPPQPEPSVPGLTPREAEVWRHLKDGLSNKEIANRLGLRDVTVKLHVRSLFRKLGVSNRTMAANRYRELMEGKPSTG